MNTPEIEERAGICWICMVCATCGLTPAITNGVSGVNIVG